MANVTKIQWTDHTFNPWRGCTKVSPGCAHCYAETLAARNPKVLGVWGPQGTRPVAAQAYWRQPIKWNAEAAKARVQRRVFCASLADVFEERPDLEAPRRRLFELIAATPALDWQLLTKRPENILPMQQRMLAADLVASGSFPWPNVWYMASVENHEYADRRIPELLRVPARVRGLSVEPLLRPVDLRTWLHPPCSGDVRSGHLCQLCHSWQCPIHGVIIGGESGPKARPCQVEWVRDLIQQCQAAGVACFVKQLGARVEDAGTTSADTFPESQCWPEGTRTDHHRVLLRDGKGGDPAEWPEDLRIREFPVTYPFPG
jgi:protein gp37